MDMSRKGFAPIIAVLIIAVVLVAGGAYWYFHRSTGAPRVVSQQKNGLSPSLIFPPEATSSFNLYSDASTTASDIPGWQTCDFTSIGFAIEYPSDWGIYVSGRAEGMGGFFTPTDCQFVTDGFGEIEGIVLAPTSGYTATSASAFFNYFNIKDGMKVLEDSYLGADYWNTTGAENNEVCDYTSSTVWSMVSQQIRSRLHRMIP